jgi:hypothetical protein
MRWKFSNTHVYKKRLNEHKFVYKHFGLEESLGVTIV